MTSPAPNRSRLVIAIFTVALVALAVVYYRRASVPTVRVVTAAATSSPTGGVSGSSGVTAIGSVVALADPITFEVEADVNQVSMGRIRAGQPARITLDAAPDTAFRGVVRQVAPPVDRQPATARVNVSVLDRDPRIQPHASVRVDFIEPDTGNIRGQFVQPRIRVPAPAVREQDGQAVVWLVRDGRLEARMVDASPESGGFREIYTGLSGGEVLMVGGVETPVEGMRVKLAE